MRNFYKMNINKSKRPAFTLAEVLITLGIIGVVASLTIPTLIKNYQKEQTVSQLKKAYTELSQAIKLSEIDNGPAKDWIWGTEDDSFTAEDFFNEYWKPYLKVSKVCSDYPDCGYKKSKWDMVKGTNSIALTTSAPSRTLLILNDGTILFLLSYTGSHSSVKDIYVDINGAKNPNKIGIDVFVFEINNKGLVPLGSSPSGCITASNYCAKKIMADGWQIKDDYPWD